MQNYNNLDKDSKYAKILATVSRCVSPKTHTSRLASSAKAPSVMLTFCASLNSRACNKPWTLWIRLESV